MSNSMGILKLPFFSRRQSFLLTMLGTLFGGRVVSAPAEQELSASHDKTARKKSYKMVVLTNPVAGKEDEFNDWYTNRHLADVLAIPGFVRAQRFKMVTPLAEHPWRYCAFYELETDDPKAAVNELISRHGTEKLPSSDAMDPNAYAVIYEVLTPVMTKKEGAA